MKKLIPLFLMMACSFKETRKFAVGDCVRSVPIGDDHKESWETKQFETTYVDQILEIGNHSYRTKFCDMDENCQVVRTQYYDGVVSNLSFVLERHYVKVDFPETMQ